MKSQAISTTQGDIVIYISNIMYMMCVILHVSRD